MRGISRLRNNGAVRQLQDRLESEHQGNILWREVQGNSRTASRQAIDEDLGAAVKGSSMSLKGMAASVVSHIADRATAEFRNQVKDRIAQVVTETNPETVSDLMAEITRRAQADRDFADLLHRSGVLGIKPYGANIVPNGPQE